jgi:hypothetical protein
LCIHSVLGLYNKYPPARTQKEGKAAKASKTSIIKTGTGLAIREVQDEIGPHRAGKPETKETKMRVLASREEAIAVAGQDVVEALDKVNCEMTCRLTDGGPYAGYEEFSSDTLVIKEVDGEEVEVRLSAYWYVDSKTIAETEELDTLDWQEALAGYDVSEFPTQRVVGCIDCGASIQQKRKGARRKRCATCRKQQAVKAVAKWKKEQLSAGRCTTCGKNNENTTEQCGDCASKTTLRSQKRYLRLKKEGRCYRCGGIPQGGHVTCPKCLQRVREKSKLKS